ncbi:MAG TPA: hypothetical protein VFA63_04000 [Pseudonocardiaceae bacterium]|nr:hypothetical protein [Pseudonocardiaceae bacterium]
MDTDAPGFLRGGLNTAVTTLGLPALAIPLEDASPDVHLDATTDVTWRLQLWTLLIDHTAGGVAPVVDCSSASGMQFLSVFIDSPT